MKIDNGEEFIRRYAQRMLGEFGAEAVNVLRTSLEKKKLVSSRELYDQLRYDIIKATAETVAAAGISFANYGRWRDMRNVKYTRPLPHDEITDRLIPWVEKIGVGRFKYVPGYPDKSKVPSEDAAVRRIAWGIGMGLHLGKSPYRSKQWYAKVLWAKIAEFTDEVRLEYNNYYRDQLKKGLPKKI